MICRGAARAFFLTTRYDINERVKKTGEGANRSTKICSMIIFEVYQKLKKGFILIMEDSPFEFFDEMVVLSHRKCSCTLV
jgi:hypothetical protein